MLHDSPSSRVDRAWPYWPIVPLYPYGQRRTLRREILPDTLWVFEQIQGIFYVVVPIRMTVVRLQGGGLLVYAPVAPTGECVALVRELEQRHGAVRFIVLPTVSGIEHKVFVGPFARRFPQAQVYVAANQWSFPLDLPLSWLGLPWQRTQLLPEDSREAPFGEEWDYASVGPVDLGLGPFEEVALFHRPSRTLLVTDTLVGIPTEPPEVVQLDPFPLLFHARDRVGDPVQDSPETRRKGWQRICLFAFYFRPSALVVTGLPQSIQEATRNLDPQFSWRTGSRSYFGLFPVQWQPQWVESFQALQGQEGQLRVAPILQTLILNRDPDGVWAWVDRLCRWPVEQVIPAHFAAPLATTPRQIRSAFNFLGPSSSRRKSWDFWSRGQSPGGSLPEADLQVLRGIRQLLDRLGV